VTVSLLVELTVANAVIDLAADDLWVLGATGVEIRQAAQGLAVVAAGFPTAEAARWVASQLAVRYPTAVVEVDDDDWRDVWRQFARPVTIGPLVVAPAWRPVTVDAGRQVVVIDPGRCFGGGSHPTTRLMLAEIERRLRPGDRVLDVGTGSGILAVTAAVLGACQVTAIDLDPDAVAVTRDNAARNGVTDRVDATTRDIGALHNSYQLVLANLSARALADLAADLTGAVAPAGRLLLSGLLDGQWRHLAGRFAELVVLDLPGLDGWTGAVLARPGR
jgi:ribosomal protein L11 methyltransferase